MMMRDELEPPKKGRYGRKYLRVLYSLYSLYSHYGRYGRKYLSYVDFLEVMCRIADMMSRGEDLGCHPWDAAEEGAEEAEPDKRLTETLEKLLGTTLGLSKRGGKGRGGGGSTTYDLSVDVDESDDSDLLRRYNLELENKVRGCVHCDRTLCSYTVLVHCARTLCSYTALILYSYCTHTVLILYPYCTHTVPIPYPYRCPRCAR
jgi:hypothetical protein